MNDKFGYVSQDVMKNPCISPTAKGVYAYIASFLGEEAKCSLGIDRMCRELGIDAGTLFDCIRELIEDSAIKHPALSIEVIV